ncbi:MAG: DUF1905 domain-containing protein [Acidobacteria bacterium]|nr:DUF1905 domain-containing protein [Acidobacteriota bacterium]
MPKPVKSVKLKTELVKADDSGWHFLVVDKKTADKFGFEGKYKRVVCTINKGKPFYCALMPTRGEFYIIVNKKKRDEAGVEGGDIVNVLLEKDESKYGLPMPEELAEVMKQDPAGSKLFHKLTEGRQRSLIYLVTNVKDIDRRIHTALTILDHLHDNDGKVIGKQLTEELKRPAF